MTTPTSSSKISDWKPLSRTELLWFGLLFAIVTLIPAAVFWNQLPCSDDTLPHFYRTVQLDVNLKQGMPFMQWGSEMLRGYGYTIFLFYAPLTYWLLEAIHLLGFDFGPAMQILFVLILWLAGWGGYVLARHFLSPLGAFIAGLAYLFAPYILYDAIQRGAMPETLALALVPWALAAALRALDNPRPQAVALAAVLFSLLILAHNVVPIFALGLVVLFALVSWEGSLRHDYATLIRPLKTITLILVFALGLTLFFWLPGLVELKDTQSQMQNPPLRDWPRYEQHIIPIRDLVVLPDDPADANLLNPPIPRTLGIAQMLLGFAGMIALFWYKRPLPKRQLIILAMITVAAIFFSSQWSMWGWQHLPLLNLIQMPTRFLGLSSLGVAIFSGLFVDQLARWLPGKWQIPVVLLLAALAVSISGWAWLYPRVCPVPVQPGRSDLAQATTWSRWYAEAQAELLPRWVQELPPEDSLIPQYMAEGEVNRLLMPDTSTGSVTGVTISDWQSGQSQDTYELSIVEPTSLVYQVFYFPGWQVELNGRSLPITPTSPEGFIQVEVPAGEHTLSFHFGATPLRMITLILSGLTAVILIVWVWRGRKRLLAPEPARFPKAYQKALPLFFLTAGLCVLVKFAVIDRVSSPFRADRLQNGQLANVSNPVVVQFDNEFVHLGYEAPDEVVGSDNLVVTQYWSALRDIGVPYGFSLQVVDDEGQVWSELLGRPFNYTHFPSMESWQPGEYVRDANDLKLLPGIPPGEYWLETAVFRRDTDLSLIPTGAEIGSAPDKARLGSLTVTAGDWEISEENMRVDTFDQTPLTAVPQLSLLGWTVPDVVWRPGELAKIDLLWQGNESVFDKRVVENLWLVDEDGETVAETAVIVGTPGAKNVVRDKIQWRLPPGLETGLHTVMLSTGNQTIELGQWQIDAPSRTFNAPEVDIISSASIDFAQLVGYSLLETTPTEIVEVELVWQTIGETPISYRVFVHVLDENGNLIAQSDAIPDHWTRPTTGWMIGEYIQDRHTLSLPSDATPGAYTLVVGFYEPTTGNRLGQAEIGTLTVGDE